MAAVTLTVVYVLLQFSGFIAGLAFVAWCFRQKTFRSLPWFGAYIILTFMTLLSRKIFNMDAVVKESAAALIGMAAARSAGSPGMLYLSCAVSLYILAAVMKLLILLMVFSDMFHVNLNRAAGAKPPGRCVPILESLYDRIPLLGGSLLFLQFCETVLHFLIYFRHARA